jgi:hypothetical protein
MFLTCFGQNSHWGFLQHFFSAFIWKTSQSASVLEEQIYLVIRRTFLLHPRKSWRRTESEREIPKGGVSHVADGAQKRECCSPDWKKES